MLLLASMNMVLVLLIILNAHVFFISDFQDYTPKLSDFGLAKDGPEGDDTHVSTRVMGTQGYAAPEYIMTGTNSHHSAQPCSKIGNLGYKFLD